MAALNLNYTDAFTQATLPVNVAIILSLDQRSES